MSWRSGTCPRVIAAFASRSRVARKSIASRLKVGSRIAPRRVENQCPEHPKSTLEGSKIEPRSSFWRLGPPDAFQEQPWAPQEAPRASPERRRAPQERPKSAPRAPQERPKSAQESPWKLLQAFRGALGDPFDASKLDKSAIRERSVARRTAEQILGRDFNDFRVVHAKAAKALTCVWTRKIRCFLQVAPSRVNFITKTMWHKKHTKIRQNIDQKSTEKSTWRACWDQF